MVAIFKLVTLFAVSSVVQAQDYADYGNDYAQDSIYYDYANKQVEKQAGKGGGLLKLLGTFGAGYFVSSKLGCGSKIKKMKKKHLHEQKELYTQYYNDVYKLSEYVAKLEAALQESEEKRELDLLQRDMDEFKQPDTDGDGRISRAEFNHYVKTYLANYPGLTEKDFPKWEDFDHDKSGYITFQEYRQQMALLAQQEELNNYYKQQSGQQANKEAERGLQGLYKETTKADSFNDLYAQLRKRA